MGLDSGRDESRRPSLTTIAGLLIAVAFLGGAIGYAVGSDERGGGPSEADVGFLRDMITHHEQAIIIAKEVSRYDGMPQVIESFAEEVLVFQRYEMGAMAATLRGWGEPQLVDGPAMAWMDAPVDADEMPGLATDDDLERLARAQGDERAALFLALMSKHHLGGVHMAEAAAERVKDDYVRGLALGMAQQQRAEIGEYSAARTRLGLQVPTGFTDPPTLDDGGHGGGH